MQNAIAIAIVAACLGWSAFRVLRTVLPRRGGGAGACGCSGGCPALKHPAADRQREDSGRRPAA
jgi:hypothetical protein